MSGEIVASQLKSAASVIAFNTRLGGSLFFLYLVFYVGFIYLNAFARDRMSAEAFSGINLAVVYGFGLIIAAFVLAIVYMMLCRRDDRGGSR